MMNQRPETLVVVNPRSANGRTGKHWSRIVPVVRAAVGDVAVRFTSAPGDATEITRAGLRAGAGRIISVGGDGTHYEVVNGFFQDGNVVNPDATLAILPFGTGSDLARTLGIPRGRAAVAHLAGGRAMGVDVGRARFIDRRGEPYTRYFLNAAHAGSGGAIVERVNNTSKALGGFVSFFWATITVLASHKNPMMRIEIDGEVVEQRCHDVIIANGMYDGGGMKIAPRARLNSGVFEVCIIGDASPLTALRNVPRLYRGTLDKQRDLVRCATVRRIVLESPRAVPVTLDGELPGVLPVEIDLLPSAVKVVCGM